MRKERKHYTGEEKVAMLRRHLLDKVPISDLCEEHGLQPTVFYRWQKEFFENGAAAFQGKSRPDHQAEQQRIEYLEKKIQTKDEVFSQNYSNSGKRPSMSFVNGLDAARELTVMDVTESVMWSQGVAGVLGGHRIAYAKIYRIQMRTDGEAIIPTTNSCRRWTLRR